MFKSLLVASALLVCVPVSAQVSSGTNDDLNPQTALTGGPMTPLQTAYDARHYGLNIKIDPKDKSISGYATMRAIALEEIEAVELDLDPRFIVERAIVNGSPVQPIKENGKLILPLRQAVKKGERFKTLVHYKGNPHIAERAPWDGGWVFAKTPSGEDWIATAVQGNGCDLIFPCKDHVADKTDEGVNLNIEVPKGLSAAMAGVLVEVIEREATTLFKWVSKKPMSPYHIAVNVGPYERLTWDYTSVNGTVIPVEFWALKSNADKARKLVEEDFLHQIRYFETTLGPYPWGDEKIGVAETPHLGMEHQTMNAYGNLYRSDWRSFDWLIQHEIAHEWWGNLLTQKRSKDFWLHEGTGTYMQPHYEGYNKGEDAYASYMDTIYRYIQNCAPIVPEGDPRDNELKAGNDTYYKAAWMLHTLRNVMGDEPFWNAMRITLYGTADTQNLQYPIPSVMRITEEVVAIFSQQHGKDLRWLFDVYLREAEALKLDVTTDAEGMTTFKWVAPNGRPFHLPLPITLDGKAYQVPMQGGMGVIDTAGKVLEVDPKKTILMHREDGGKICKIN